MTISLVQFISATNTINAQGATLSGTPTPGNLLVAGCWTRKFGSMTPDTGWNEITDGINMNPQAAQQSALLYKVVPSSDPAAQAVGTWSGSIAQSRVTIAEFTGLSGTPFDVSDLSKITLQSGATNEQLSITPTAGGEKLLVGLWHNVNGPTFSSSDSIIDQGLCDGSFTPKGMMLYRVVDPASGSYTLTGTVSATDGWGGAVASFAAGGGGGGGGGARTILAAVIG